MKKRPTTDTTHRCESFDGTMVPHHDDTCTASTRCDHAERIVKSGIVMCADIACAHIIDTSDHRPGLVEANQFR